ncbi:MAG: biotin/lipoyl-containing protein [Lachnospiraceae bacterium]
MKKYAITVNGITYDVTVEEKNDEIQTDIPQAAPVNMPVPKDTASQVSDENTGRIRVETGAAGKIFKLEVKIGQRVKKGEAIAILEAMKMEIPVVASSDGTVASIHVAVGDNVEAGHLLATLN